MSDSESIKGNESVEDLIAMVDRQKDISNAAGVIAMISMTTQFTNPATFNQFKKKLERERPEIYKEVKEIFTISGNNSKSESDSGCFVATATMKNYNHPIVVDLRNFRDSVLLNNFYGKLFVKFYYFFGPYFARLISKYDILRLLSYKLLILPIHNLIKKY